MGHSSNTRTSPALADNSDLVAEVFGVEGAHPLTIGAALLSVTVGIHLVSTVDAEIVLLRKNWTIANV